MVDKQKKPTKRARAETPITVSKRKRQEISLSSDEGEDEDYVPKGMKIDRFYARKITDICLFPGKVTVFSTASPAGRSEITFHLYCKFVVTILVYCLIRILA